MERMEVRSDTQSIDRNSLGRQKISFVFSDLLGYKWHAQIFELSQRRMGFSELKAEIERISGKILVESLDILTEEYGVVDRHRLDTRATRVEYSLSASGQALVPELLRLHNWADDHLDQESYE